MFYKVTVYISVVLIGYVCSVSLDLPNRCPQPTLSNPDPPAFYYVHPHDCSYFFTCAHGVPFLTACSPGTRFSEVFMTCAGDFTHYDTCSRDNAVRECSRNATLIGHPTICQRYYNCSDTTPRGSTSFLKALEMECPYPDLFDITLRKCVPFKEAYCGPYRNPGVEPCSYVNNLCGSSHCQPCSSRFPSCLGLPDGTHEHPDRLWTPSYINCDTQRTINVSLCPAHPAGGSGMFSPVSKTCVSIWEVPRETGYGLQPSCNDKAADLYRIDENPKVYYSCPGANVFYCPSETVFDNNTQKCA